MSDYGISENGFLTKPLELIITELEDELQGIFGLDLDVSPESPWGQYIGTTSAALHEAWESLAEVNSAKDPATSQGKHLDSIGRLHNLPRQPGAASTARLQLLGTPSATVTEVVTIQTDLGDLFSTFVDTIFNGSGEAIIVVRADAGFGPIPAELGSFNTLVTSHADITEIDTSYPENSLNEGVFAESDPDFRFRRDQDTGAQSLGMVESIIASYDKFGTPHPWGQMTIINNPTASPDAWGTPAHAFQPVLADQVSSDSLIRELLLVVKPPGIQCFGTTSASITDKYGVSTAVGFTVATDMPVHVQVTSATGADFPAGGDVLIKQFIVDYFNGVLPGYEDRGLGIGDSVKWDQFFIAVDQVPFHDVTEILIGLSDPASGGSQADITIELDERATFDIDDIDFVGI